MFNLEVLHSLFWPKNKQAENTAELAAGPAADIRGHHKCNGEEDRTEGMAEQTLENEELAPGGSC